MLEGLTRRAESVARRVVELEPFPQPPLCPTRYPVVLMHGFGALANLMQGGVLHAEAMHLRAHGIHAYAPHVNPYDTIAVRAASWKKRLTHILAETGASKANLIGFSSAGLDARYLAGSLGFAESIASIITVSAPHRGSALVRYLLDQPERLREGALALMEFIGRAAYETAPPHAREALEELTPDYLEATFNPVHPMPEGIYCASYAGQAGKGTDESIYPPLAVPNRILHRLSGLNDGLVAVESARWGIELGIVEADHARQIGLGFTGSSFDSKAFYLSIAEHLRTQGL
ncbi:MAG: lipase [Rhodothermaceae bacterium]|nr:lipase [Rhodothermaceae bacterium]